LAAHFLFAQRRMMRIHYEPKREDYDEASRFQGKRQDRRIWAGCFLSAMGVLFLAKHDEIPAWIPAGTVCFIGVCVLVIPIWRAYDEADKRWTRQTRLLTSTIVTADVDGIMFEGRQGSSAFKWGAFGSCDESRSLFLLYFDTTRMDLAATIPKRAFANEAELETFRSLIANISHIPGAFPIEPRGG
jgi:hypothetical protein